MPEINDIKIPERHPLVEELSKPRAAEPALEIQIGSAGGDVFVNFSKPATGIRFNKKNAREFASAILKEAMKP